MKRREFIGGLTVTLLGSSDLAFAQAPNNVPRIGVLVSASPPHPFAEALTRGLSNLGYTVGQNIVLEVRYTEGRSDRAAELAAELVRLKVDLIDSHFTQGRTSRRGD
jgi:putative ABC transport system substrate-binding protein